MHTIFRLLVLSVFLLVSGFLGCKGTDESAPAPKTASGSSASSRAAIFVDQGKIDSAVNELLAWGKDKNLASSVEAYASNPPAASKTMTPEAWKALSPKSDSWKIFAENETSKFLLAKRNTKWLAQAFVSGKDGKKVGFIHKPGIWQQQNKEISEPLAGRVWRAKTPSPNGILRVMVPISSAKGDVVGVLVADLNVKNL